MVRENEWRDGQGEEANTHPTSPLNRHRAWVRAFRFEHAQIASEPQALDCWRSSSQDLEAHGRGTSVAGFCSLKSEALGL